MNTNERERLEQLREQRAEAKKLSWMDHPPQPTWADIEFLLSLIDSQAAGNTPNLLRRLKDFLFENCDHRERDRNYDWCPSCVMAFMEVVSKPSDSDAATRMREACVARLRQIAADYDKLQYPNTGAAISKQALMYAARQLESVTLDSVNNDEGEGVE